MADDATYDLKTVTLNDVGIRTAQVARVKENDVLATSEDDAPALALFYDSGLIALATLANLVTSIVPGDKGQINIPQELIPRRLWTALTYSIMKDWFKTIGEFELAEFYAAEYEKESSLYRFKPDTPMTARRTYRPF